jgi:hypothetical protein
MEGAGLYCLSLYELYGGSRARSMCKSEKTDLDLYIASFVASSALMSINSSRSNPRHLSYHTARLFSLWPLTTGARVRTR